MAKGSSKKSGDPKCRVCGGLLEGRPTVNIGGSKWHQECAEKQGKFIPLEYREGYVSKTPVETVAPAEEETVVAAETAEEAVETAAPEEIIAAE